MPESVTYKSLFSLISIEIALLSISSMRIPSIFCKKLNISEILTVIFSFTFVSDRIGKIMKSKIKNTVKKIVELLADKKYDELKAITKSDLSPAEIKAIIEEFGERIIVPSDDKFDGIDIVEIEIAETESYSVDFDLWTKESGLSDLTLQLTVINGNGNIRAILDSIHVL